MSAVLALLVSMASVRGKVVSEGQPLPGVEVTITSSRRSARVITNIAGEYAFDALESGPYEVAFDLDGFETARQRIRVGPGENDLSEQTLQVNATEIVLECNSPCTAAGPKDEWDRPSCDEYGLDTALEESSGRGDASAIALLVQRHQTTLSRLEKLRVAGMLLRRVADDSAYWRELSEDAEIAVRFVGNDSDRGAHGVEERYLDGAWAALEIVGHDPRSHALLLRGLESNDDGVVTMAILGFAAQHDLDVLPKIDAALQRLGNNAHAAPLALAAFDAEAADQVAAKYVSEDDRDRYLEWRPGAAAPSR